MPRTVDRWRSAPISTKVPYGQESPAGAYRLLDEQYPTTEQLPRQFDVVFCQTMSSGKPHVSVFANGQRVGDELTDNSYTDDGYRFHDVFHFGFAALLGWSPMTRTLFRCKRRSVPAVDEVEDGGRSKVLEEAICALIYDYARQRNYLAHSERVEPELTNGIRSLVWDREVKERSEADWEFAILQIYNVFRQIWSNAGGVIKADLSRRHFDYVAKDDSESATGTRQ